MLTPKVNRSHHVPACPGARTGNKQVMHRLRPAILCFLGVVLLGFVGCSAGSPQPGLIRSIYVEGSVCAPTSDLAQYADVIHDTSVRVLIERGYVAAMEPASADAFLRASWLARPAIAGTPQSRVTLQMTLVSRGGAVLSVLDIVTDTPAGFLSRERISDHIREKLGTIIPGPRSVP